MPSLLYSQLLPLQSVFQNKDHTGILKLKTTGIANSWDEYTFTIDSELNLYYEGNIKNLTAIDPRQDLEGRGRGRGRGFKRYKPHRFDFICEGGTIVAVSASNNNDRIEWIKIVEKFLINKITDQLLSIGQLLLSNHLFRGILFPEWGLSHTVYNNKFQREGICKLLLVDSQKNKKEYDYNKALNTITGYQFEGSYQWARGRCIFNRELGDFTIEYSIQTKVVNFFENLHLGFCTRNGFVDHSYDLPKDYYILSLKYTSDGTELQFKGLKQNGNEEVKSYNNNVLNSSISRALSTRNRFFKIIVNVKNNKLFFELPDGHGIESLEIDNNNFNNSHTEIVPVVCLGDPDLSVKIDQISFSEHIF